MLILIHAIVVIGGVATILIIRAVRLHSFYRKNKVCPNCGTKLEKSKEEEYIEKTQMAGKTFRGDVIQFIHSAVCSKCGYNYKSKISKNLLKL